MSRVYPGLYRVLVRFTWPDGASGFDFTDEPAPYEECQRVSMILGWGHPWEVSSLGQTVFVHVEGALIVGPVVP